MFLYYNNAQKPYVLVPIKHNVTLQCGNIKDIPSMKVHALTHVESHDIH